MKRILILPPTGNTAENTEGKPASSESGNPSAGAGTALITIPAAAAAVVFSQKGRR